MPPLRHSLTRPSSNPRKAPPDGFSDLEATLLEFAQRLRDATTSSGGGGGGGGGRPAIGTRKHEAAWPVFQITHQRSRYIYELYYEKEAISKELYDWLGRNGYVDLLLVAKWKKQGYEKVSLGYLLSLDAL